MMRYFYYLTGWLAFGLAHPALAQADSAASSPSQQHFAPMDDWQLPSFVANSTSASDSAPPAPSHKPAPVVTHVSLNFGDSHPSPSSSSSGKSPRTASTSRIPTSGTASTSGTKSPRTASSARVNSDKIVSSSTPKPGKIPSPDLTDKSLKTSHLKESSLASASKSDSSAPAFHSTASTKGSDADHAFVQAAHSTAAAARNGFSAAKTAFAGRLARLTAYWAGEGDYYTGRHISSTGIHLHGGVCAVDPSIIPYGSVVVIPGLGQFLAADTGSAVVSREAAREAGRTLAERSALVIDIFFDRRSDGEAFAAEKPVFVPISWWTPRSTSNAAQAARSVFADENWNKIYSKQL